MVLIVSRAADESNLRFISPRLPQASHMNTWSLRQTYARWLSDSQPVYRAETSRASGEGGTILVLSLFIMITIAEVFLNENPIEIFKSNDRDTGMDGSNQS